MKKLNLMILFCLLPWFYCQAQPAVAADTIAARLSRFEQNLPQEKAYLQFDKPYYAAGDTIYFAAYVTKGRLHKLSNISGVLHVDFVNTKNRIDQSIKLQLDSGIAHGDFALPDSLPAGNYRIRAYTQWMRNRGDNGFFEQCIPLGPVKPVKIPESMVKQAPALQKPDIQFMPEGGSLIAGIPSIMAFKAVGPDGLGIAATGEVLDTAGRVITSFSSAHLGMGEFGFTPPAEKPCRARVTFADGQQSIIELPRAQMNGIALSVDNDAIPVAKVTISANEGYYDQHKGKAYTLLIRSGGSITTINCKLDSAVIKFDILKRRLHTGIATVTLFSSAGEPLAERLFFVQNYDQLSLNIGTDKQSYTPREKVSIKLNALNRKGEASEGHFSVSVVNESIAPETDKYAGNILTSLLLTSDVKGYVEQPGYYFADTSAVVQQHLDLLMLTQGYRGFEWRKVLDSTDINPKYGPEQGVDIAGKVNSVTGNAVANGTVTLIPTKGGAFLTAQSDHSGIFHFTNLIFTDTARFVLNAVKANGKNSTKITWFGDNYDRLAVHPFADGFGNRFTDTVLQAYAQTDKVQRTEVASYLNIKKGVMLKEVNVHDKYETQSLAGAGNADQVLHSKDIGYGPSLSVMLNGKLRYGIKMVRGLPYRPGFGVMSVYLDGERMATQGGLGVDIVNLSDVETVEILTTPANVGVYGMDGGHGVMVITTKKGGGLKPGDISSIGVLPIKAMGFYKARVFYSPVYDGTQKKAGQKDLRSTIFWEPGLKTGTDGQAAFDFYNADGAGVYKVTVEGIDKDGNIGRQVIRYQVQ